MLARTTVCSAQAMDQKIKDGKQAELKPEDMPDMTKFAEAQKQMQVATGPSLGHPAP